MKKLLFTTALLAAGGLCLHDISVGHGGTYRGPGDTVPPGGGGGGGGGGPSGPSAPGSPGSGGGPSGPGRSSPGTGATGPQGGPATPRSSGGSGGSEDLEAWQFWWGFNKEPYLNLKSAIHSGSAATGSDDFFLGKGEQTASRDTYKPSEETIRQVVVPALREALATERDNDIVTGCMIALAKIGDPKDEAGEGKAGFAADIQKFLTDSSQEIKETAAVALGILGNTSSLPLLTSLALNTPEWRELSGAPQSASGDVDDRTRSFALYGLGLIGYRTEDMQVRKDIVGTLVQILEGDGFESSQRDLSVAALIAMGLVPLESNPSWELAKDEVLDPKACREAQIKWLLAYYGSDEENYLIRAHVPVTMARLVQFADPRHLFRNDADKNFKELKTEIATRLLEDISERSKESTEIQQSAVLALGLLGDSDEDDIDKEIRKALIELDLAQPQSRNFAVISLAHVGGRPGHGEGNPIAGYTDAKKALLFDLAKGQSARKSWSGLALGVLERSLVDAAQPVLMKESADALRSELAKANTPRDVGAFALALGIMGDQSGKTELLEKFEQSSDPDTRGYCAIALGLLGDPSVIETIQETVEKSKFQGDLLRSAATALGLLGDKRIVSSLTTMLADAKALSSQAAIAQALGFIGDANSIQPLVDMLKNKSLTGGARGFAAVALGIVGDKEELPWNTKISVNLNYRANTTTLTDSAAGTGILDIL